MKTRYYTTPQESHRRMVAAMTAEREAAIAEIKAKDWPLWMQSKAIAALERMGLDFERASAAKNLSTLSR